MKYIFAWPKWIWLTGRRINHFLIARFDENRAIYCFVWFPLVMISVVLAALICLALHQAIGGMAAMIFMAPIYILFYLPWAGLFLVSFFLVSQAYIGVFARLGVPLFIWAERFVAELVTPFRDGGTPHSGSNERP